MNESEMEKITVEVQAGDPFSVSAAGLVVGVWDDGRMALDWKKRLDSVLGGEFSRILEHGEFRGESQEILFLPTFGKIPARYVILAGLGNRDKTPSETIRKISGCVATTARRRNLATLHSTLASNASDEADLASEAVVEGTLLGLYRFPGTNPARRAYTRRGRPQNPITP